MGINFSLSLVEHELVVVSGLAALDQGSEDELRRVVLEILERPFEVDAEVVEAKQKKLDFLRSTNAPPVLLSYAEGTLAELRGTNRRRELAESADFEGLARLLIHWGRYGQHRFELDKSWDLIHWFADPLRRSEGLSEGSLSSLIGIAIYGCEEVPARGSGEPLWESSEGSSYNPPEAVVEIHEALARVNTDDWDAVHSLLADADPELIPHCAHGVDPADLNYAKHYFKPMRSAYACAARLGLGISTDFA